MRKECGPLRLTAFDTSSAGAGEAALGWAGCGLLEGEAEDGAWGLGLDCGDVWNTGWWWGVGRTLDHPSTHLMRATLPEEFRHADEPAEFSIHWTF